MFIRPAGVACLSRGLMLEAPTPTCVIANAIKYQADSQGLALHPVSVLREGLENKAGIVKDPGHRCVPKVSPRHHLSLWVFLNGPLAGKSVNSQRLTSSQLTFPFNIKLFLYSGNVLQSTSYFCFFILFNCEENCSLFTRVLALQEKDHLRQREKMDHIFLRNLSLYR